MPIKTGCLGAEPWSFKTRPILERELGGKGVRFICLKELNGPYIAFECKEQDGLHFWSDHFIVEKVKPDVTPCKDGERGELALASLTIEARPLLRYGT
ncbi:MAG: hypothetical protein LUQ34_00220 [Euryarchaeota archaeon]|nr:hypothetical protein [Euryarchaeota archaeon]